MITTEGQVWQEDVGPVDLGPLDRIRLSRHLDG